MTFTCHACGARFRSMSAEARHRHNFPALCKRNTRFERWSRAANAQAIRDKIASLRPGQLYVVRWMGGDDHVMSAVYGHVSTELAEVHLSANGDRSLVRVDITGDWVTEKFRVDVVPDALVEGFHMLIEHGLREQAGKLVGWRP